MDGTVSGAQQLTYVCCANIQYAVKYKIVCYLMTVLLVLNVGLLFEF